MQVNFNRIDDPTITLYRLIQQQIEEQEKVEKKNQP
jgi:hypothetical protein